MGGFGGRGCEPAAALERNGPPILSHLALPWSCTSASVEWECGSIEKSFMVFVL